MSRANLAALTTLLIVASIPATASAQNHFRGAPEYQSKQAVNRSSARIPSNAFGSVNMGTSFGQPANDVVFGGKFVGRDPDANVRFDILRDGQFATSR